MKTRWLTLPSAALTLFSACFAQQYDITVIEGLPGAEYTYTQAMNSRGQVIGQSIFASGERRAYIWESGSVTDLGDLGSDRVVPIDLNEHGTVVGSAKDEKGEYQAFVWTRRMGIRQLFHAVRSEANGINDYGDIVGNINGRPYLLRRHELQMLPSFSSQFCTASAINNSGITAGYGLPENGGHWVYPVRWISGNLELLAGGVALYPVEINSHGQIAGLHSTHYPHTQYPVTWIGNSFVELPSIVGVGGAYGINYAGEIVGYVLDRNWQYYTACLWRNMEMVVLEPLVNSNSWTALDSASDIDRYGRIAGQGVYQGNFRGFLLTPTGKSR